MIKPRGNCLSLCVILFHLTLWFQGALIFLQMTRAYLALWKSAVPLRINIIPSSSIHLLVDIYTASKI